MSTVFCPKAIPYLIHSKHVNLKKRFSNLLRKSLTDLWVSKTGLPYLYGSRTHDQIIEHVSRRLDASETENRDLHRLPGLPNLPQGDRLDGRTGQAPCRAAQARPAGGVIDGHGGIGVRNGQRVRSRLLRCPCNTPNICNERR